MIELELDYPVSANRYWRMFRGRMVRSSEANAYRQHVTQETLDWDDPLTEGPVKVYLTLHPKMRKDGLASETVIDLDNCIKVGLDALQGIVFFNDKQVKRLVASYGEPKPGGGLSVRVEEI